MATLKPPTPLFTPNTGPLKPMTPLLVLKTGPVKPASPLHPQTAPQAPISDPHRRWRFQSHTDTSKQRRQGFQSDASRHEHRCHRFHARDFRFKRAMASPDQHRFACNSATGTSRVSMQSLRFQAFHGATDWRRQGIACETAKQ